MAKPRQPTDRQPQSRPPQSRQVQSRQVQSRQAAPSAPPAPQPPQPEGPPGSVRFAAWFMYAGAALSALDLILTLATAGQARSALHAAEPHWSASRLSATVHTEIAYFVVVWAITIALWLVMARVNLAGRGWARIVATVLCVLSTLSFADDIHEPSSLVSKLILVPMWLVGVAALTMLWRRQTTDYIRSQKA